MKNPILVPELRELIEEANPAECREFCASAHPEDIAGFLSALEPDEAWAVLRHAPIGPRAEIFSRLDDEVRLDVAVAMARDDLAQLLTAMAPDDRADLFREMPEEKREAVLPALAVAERQDIRNLTAYPEGTAGAIMTSDYATLAPALTAAGAIERLRLEAPDKETIYYAYVLDPERRLLGFVSLKDLILAHPGARIESIMSRDVIKAGADDDQEEAARALAKFDLLAIPVVDREGRLVGIITHDDAMDVITQEQTEDLEKIMAIGGTHEAGAYLRTSVWQHFRNRVVWIVPLALIGLIAGLIVQSYEGLLLQVAILATFMPMLADTGGNTGSQAATLVVRALALKEVQARDVWRVLGKEVSVALLLALVLGFLAFLRALYFAGKSGVPEHITAAQVGVAVAVALGLQVITATAIGALLPLAAARMKVDPALVASPALTTVVDITGLLLFFSIAKAMLSL